MAKPMSPAAFSDVSNTAVEAIPGPACTAHPELVFTNTMWRMETPVFVSYINI
jgi:hypothetical protein